MATNTREMSGSPERVWAVLADPDQYGMWVVGTKRVRSSEANWPAKYSRFFHTVGIWPFYLHDQTSVVQSDPPRTLVLQARVRPFGSAHIKLEISPSPQGTLVTMTEEPSTPAVARVARRLFDPLIYARNGEALRRLDGLVSKVHM